MYSNFCSNDPFFEFCKKFWNTGVHGANLVRCNSEKRKNLLRIIIVRILEMFYRFGS